MHVRVFVNVQKNKSVEIYASMKKLKFLQSSFMANSFSKKGQVQDD